MKKVILIGAVVLVVIIGAGVYFFMTGLDALVKAAVERAGSEVTQVSVTLDKANVSLADGRATLNGLKVGNPPGFKTADAFTMGAISVTVDTGTVTQDPVVIKEVVVTNPEVTYELGEQGSNIDAIKKNVDKFSGGGGGGQPSESSGPKVVIQNLYVRGGKVNISAVPLGGKSMTAALPEIHLKDIGKDKGGASPGQVAEKVMAALTSRIGGFVSGLDISGVFEGVGQVPDALKGLAGGAMGKAGEATKGMTEGAGKAVEGVTKGAGDAVKKLLGD